jgi:elongation factor P
MAEIVGTNQFRNGMHIELDGGVWRIVEFQHVKPGKGGAFVRTKREEPRHRRRRRPHLPRRREVPRVHTEVKNMQYLYDDGRRGRLHGRGDLRADRAAARVVATRLDVHAAVVVVQMLTVDGSRRRAAAGVGRADRDGDRAGVQGDTVSNVTKPATLETGATCRCRCS